MFYLMTHSTQFFNGYKAVCIWLMMHSTHFLYCYMGLDMIRNHSDRKRINGLHFLISSKGSFMYTIPETGKYIPDHLLHEQWSTGWNEK